MAFCAVTQDNLKNLTLLTHATIRKDPAALKNFKAFTQSMISTLTKKGVEMEKVLTLASYLPQIVSEFNSEREDRKLLKDAGVSMDAISGVEEQFESYEGISKYLDLRASTTPLVIVNDKQMGTESAIDKYVTGNKVEMAGDTRVINGKKYETRVTSIAKAGFDEPMDPEEAAQNPALKHGNTVDSIAKAIFDDITPKFEDFKDLMEPQAFDALVAQLRTVKTSMQNSGFIFRTGVTVFDPKTGISGEIDLAAINAEGRVLVMDFKTANQRFNEPYLKNSKLTYKSDEVAYNVSILSKWEQYATQGYIYSKLLSEQLGLPAIEKVGILGINISYDATLPIDQSKISKVVEIQIHNIPFSDVRKEFENKSIQEMNDQYKSMQKQEEGPKTEIAPLKERVRRKSLDRAAKIDEAAATDGELAKEIEWLRSSPLGKSTLLALSDQVNTGLFGNWTLSGITLFKNASKGTIYHEGWHQFSQVFMTPEQKTLLYKSVQKDGIKYRTRDGRNINTSTADFLDIEEFLAEEFSKFGLNPDAYKYPTRNPEPRNLFQRIWDFLLRYFGLNPRPIEVFQKLYTGKIGQYIPSVNNAYWGNLNSLAENSKGEEIIANERFPFYKEAMDYLIGKELRDANKSFTAFKQSRRLQSVVLNNMFATLQDKYDDSTTPLDVRNELASILNNKFDFTNIYLKSSEYDTLKGFLVEEKIFENVSEDFDTLDSIREEYTDEDMEETIDDVSKPDQLFTPDGNETSAFSLADDAIQDFFRTIPKIKNLTYNPDGTVANIEYQLGELGFPVNHTFYDVFYKTKKILSSAFDMPELLARMANKENQRIFPELGIVNQYITEFLENPQEPNFYRAIQNVQFLQAFWHVMTMPEVENKQLTINFLPLTQDYKTFKPTMVSFRTITRSLSQKIIKTWEKDFKDRRNKSYASFESFDQDKSRVPYTPLYLTEDGKILLNPFADFTVFNNTIQGVKDFWATMGVNFNPKVFQDPESVDKLKERKATLLNNIAIYREYAYSEFLLDANEALVSMGEPVDNLTTLGEYIQAMPDILLDILAKDHFINNPVSFFNERREYKVPTTVAGKETTVTKSTAPLRYLFEELAVMEEKFGDRVSSGSYRIEDKTKYPYYIPNNLLITANLINKQTALASFGEQRYLSNIDPLKNKWINRSYFMRKMFDYNGVRQLDKDGKPVNLLVEDFASVRSITEDSVNEVHPRSLTTDQKFFADVLSLFNGGFLENMRAETSSSIFGIHLSTYGTGKNLPISIGEATGVTIPEAFHEIVKQYFAGEIEKRQWFMKNDPVIKGYNEAPLAKQFNVFEGILPKGLKDKVVKKLKKMTADEILADPEIETAFRAAIEDYFLARIEAIKPRFDAIERSKVGLTKDQITILKETTGAKTLRNLTPVTKAFVLNHFILNQEFQTLFFGDLYFYKNPFKRGKYVTNTGATFYIDDQRNQWLNNLHNESLASVYSGQKAGGKDFSNIKTSIIEDVEMKSAYVSDVDSENQILQDTLAARIDAGILVPNTDEYNAFLAKKKGEYKKYSSINIADGQGIIGMDFYRNFSIITNIWDEKKEREYERQKAILRFHKNLYHNLTGDELAAAKETDKELINHKPFAFFNPLKISYTGPQQTDGPTHPVFDKFSVRPMIPEAALGKRDEALMLRMLEKDIDYVKFRSGTKIYQDSGFNWFKKVGKGQYDLSDFSSEEIPDGNLLYAAYLKHQLSTEGIKEENILGSQFRKIVFGIKYSPLVRNNANLVSYFTRLEDKFRGTVEKMIEVEQNDLFTLLGISEKGGMYRVSDMQKFLKLLTSESVKRGIAINNIDYIQYDDATKNSKYPIDYAFNRQQIQDLLSGLIDDRLRRLKVNGSPLIQVSSAGSENINAPVPPGSKNPIKGMYGAFKKPTREEIDKYGTTGLHYYTLIYKDGKPIKTGTMGVKVALIKEFKNLLNLEAPKSWGTSDTENRVSGLLKTGEVGRENNPIYSSGKIKAAGMSDADALIRLNEAMKDPEWKAENMDKLIMIGYRIPTQNNNFIDRMEIMEFLPESAGAIIIPPIELIVKSGSDFDIDKMNVLKPALANFSGARVRTPKEDLQEISENIAKMTLEQRDIKAAMKQFESIENTAGAEIEPLLTLSGKVRMTMLHLSILTNVDTSVIDKIMANIVNNRPVIIPNEKEITEDLAFSDEEAFEIVDELQRVTAQYDALDQRIQALIKQKDAAKASRDKAKKLDMKWFDKRKAYKDAQNNEMLDTLDELLSHPYYYEMLVTPSSAAMFEEWTNELIGSQADMARSDFATAMQKNKDKLYDKVKTPTENSTYEASLEAFDNLLSKRKDLGGYAIQRTFADIFNSVKFSIAKSYTVKIGGNDYATKVLHTPLIAPADRSKSLQNGRLLMYGDSVTGIPIAKSFDELISLTVDLAGAPAYPRMGINNYNKKHVQYLLHQKTDPKVVLWFMNQPILKSLFKLYEEKRRSVDGYQLRHAMAEMALKNKILDNPSKSEEYVNPKYKVYKSEKIPARYDQFDELVEGTGIYFENKKKANKYLARTYYDINEQNLTDQDHFSFNAMDTAIRNSASDTVTPEDTALQKKVLAYFIAISEEADWVMKLQFANNVDTTTYATLTSLIRNENNRKNLRTTDLFAEDQLNKIEKNTMIAPFDYTKKAKEILKTLFPKIYTTSTIAAFSRIVNDVFGAKNIQIERISKIVENDYIEFIYKNYGTYQGKNLSETFKPQLINTDEAQNHDYFAYRLLKLKSKYPELAEVPFVSALYEDVYNSPLKDIENSYEGLDNKEIHNIFFLRNPDNPTFEKNVFTGNWRNLISFDPTKLGIDKEYSANEMLEIGDFFHDLIYFSLYQSGLTNTGNGFSDLIPYEYWAHFIQTTFDAYDRAKETNSSLEDEMLRVFENRFKQMNPKVNWSTKAIEVDVNNLTDVELDKLNITDEDLLRINTEQGGMVSFPLLMYKNYYRGKQYLVTDDDLKFFRGPAGAIESQKGFELGRYAMFNGEKYALIRRLNKPGLWQIYNPSTSGPGAKTSAYEKNMIPLKEKGVVVLHGLKPYLVTPEEEIVDFENNMTVTWTKDSPLRKQVLKLAKDKNPPLPPSEDNTGGGAVGPPGNPKISPDC